jgi:stearoyl-CoA desaturase (delta-9 desaturase)
MITVIATLIMTHITIVCVTLYLHRSQAHRSVEFHPAVSHFMRLWLWMSTGMITKQWVAIHRSHHRHSDQSGDPHSPHVWGIWRVLFGGAWLYNDAAKDKKLIEQYGAGTPNDWIERNIYSPYPWHGVLLMLAIDIALFGLWGFVVWGIQMIWIPFWAAGVINGLGHWIGYRNGETRDKSRNLLPWGIWIGGEELHNGHHLNPAGAKLSHRWWEFDIGWMYIRLLSWFRLARVKTV